MNKSKSCWKHVLYMIDCKFMNIKVIWVFLLVFTCLVLLRYRSYTIINYPRSRLERPVIRTTTSQEFDSTCSTVLYGNLSESNWTLPTSPDLTTDEEVLNLTQGGCSDIINKYSLVTSNDFISRDEEERPVAFSLLVHQNVHQILLLLSAIYYPQNAYCIHVDKGSPEILLAALENVAKCFSNVILATKRERVIYASFSRLQADLNCMEDLLSSTIKWNYLINLSGQDFPIKTNFQIVQTLKKLKGKNRIAGYEKPNKLILDRTKFVHRVENRTTSEGKVEKFMVQTTTLKSPPPYNMTVRKNLAYNVYTRTFLSWVIFESEKAKALLEWSRDTLTPDEHFWLMLDSQEEAPGGNNDFTMSHLTHFIKWRFGKDNCAGYIKHYSCVFGSGDVKRMLLQKKLFANKFDITYDSLPMTCIRKWLERKKLEKHSGKL